MRRIVMGIIVALVLMIMSIPAFSVDVYVSTLTKDAICVRLTEQDILSVQNDASTAQYLGREIAYDLIEEAGIPESITGKVAAFVAWVPLCEKYTLDIKRVAKEIPRGSPVTLKYSGVNLNGVRKLWRASAVGDYILPGGQLTKQAADAINRIINIYLSSQRR